MAITGASRQEFRILRAVTFILRGRMTTSGSHRVNVLDLRQQSSEPFLLPLLRFQSPHD